MTDKANKAEEKKLLPGVGVDVGTANIVVARRYEDGSFAIRHHRNMLYEMDVSEEAQDLLERSKFLYLKTENKYYIVGEDALTVANAIGKGEIVRPMQNGLLNPSLKKAQDLLFFILKTVLGKPISDKEPLRFSVPANPVDAPIDNEFHKMVLQDFFDSLGFASKPINEALANLYSERPVMKVEGEEDRQLTGFSCSYGAGMVNCCFAMNGMSLVEFSNTKCGDHIDWKISTISGMPVTRIIKIKERDLDLSKPDQGDKVLMGLYVYYSEMIKRVLKNIGTELAKTDKSFDGPVEIVVCGGTAMAKGFIDRLKKVVDETELPFKVADVRMSQNPFFSVSRGACLAARADFEKRNKEK
jgi:hypothetical protein